MPPQKNCSAKRKNICIPSLFQIYVFAYFDYFVFSFLCQRFEKKHGQHILRNPGVLDKIVNAADIRQTDTVRKENKKQIKRKHNIFLKHILFFFLHILNFCLFLRFWKLVRVLVT